MQMHLDFLVDDADAAEARDHMTKTDGLEANFDNVENYLRSLMP